MKNRSLIRIGTTALAILSLTMFIPISLSAQSNNDSDQSSQPIKKTDSAFRNSDAKLVGTWDVQVTLRVCQTGAEIRTFPSVTTFMSGGTMLDSTSGIPQALKTPGQGVCSQIEGKRYRFKFKSFNFDAAGIFTGRTIVKHEAHLNRRAEEVDSAGTAQVYSPNGVMVFSGCSTTTAARFE